MNIRRLGFELISRFKGSPVIQYINEFDLNEAQKKKLAEKRLENLLALAKRKTNFYSGYDEFKDFPIISKATLREHYDSFLSRELNKEQSIITTTSGSTGQPMTFYLSKNKKYRQNAEVIFYNRWANIDLGDLHGYARVLEGKSKIQLFTQNQIIMNPKSLTDEWLDRQIDILQKKRVTGLIGYPSAISAIANRVNEKEINQKSFHIKGIVTIGENLNKNDELIIEEAFNRKPISRYTTEEFGVLACSCPGCGKFHINDMGYIIEILDENNQKVKIGEAGRIVVTDLFSDNMPLIRFDTGDIAVYGGKSDCSFYKTGVVLDSIIGRQIETVFDISGNPISAFNINGALRDFTTIKQFQFIQDSLEKNTLLLVISSDFSIEEKKLIEKRFNEILGTIPKIEIVDEIPAAKSGKRPYVVNNYSKRM